jgi:dolichol-phosphate mannosyltransferase
VSASRVVVVLPTYNEVHVIEETLHELLDRPCRPDVLVVDDNSPDGTADLVRSVAASSAGRVCLLSRPARRGLGQAYTHGFRQVLDQRRYDVIVQMDADGSHPCADIDRLVAALDESDVAIGSRYVPGGRPEGLTLARRWLSRGGNYYARLVLGTGVRDLTGGFKAWRADLLDRLDSGTTVSDGYAFQVEMTVRAVADGARVREVPIHFRPRRAGRSKMNARIAVEAIAVMPWLARRYPSYPSRGGRADRHARP